MIKEQLQKIEMFKSLTELEIEKLLNISIVKKLSRENILFYEGEKPQFFYVLLDGFIKIYKTDLKGNEIVLHLFKKPTFLAEMPSFENIPFPATAISMKDESQFLLIDRESFLTLLHSDFQFSLYLIKSLSQKIRNLEQVINRNLIYDAMTKVCSFIKENPTDVATIKHKDIAILLNMAPETLSRILKKLKNLDIIDKKGMLVNPQKIEIFLTF